MVGDLIVLLWLYIQLVFLTIFCTIFDFITVNLALYGKKQLKHI